MKIVPVADVKTRFSSYLEQSQEGPIIITRNGRPVAVLLAVTDEEELERLVLAHTPRFRQLLAAAEQRIRQTGGMSHAEFWQAVENASAEEHPAQNEADGDGTPPRAA